MTTSVLTEILDWSRDRPAWQRDALRRLFTGGELGPGEIADLVEISKAAHGLAEDRPVDPLTKKHLAIGESGAGPISLTSVMHHGGVNALAAEQVISFGPNLTVVYGENAAGKSGYTRILKQACRSRGTENIIGNVLGGMAPVTPHATITVREGNSESAYDWSPKSQASERLAAVSIFDAHCVPVYLRDKTDVAFRPFGLDVFDKLATACGDVRQALEKERATLNASAAVLPLLPDGTASRKLLDGLTSLTSPEVVRGTATLTTAEENRLGELRKEQRDFQTAEPQKLAQDLTLRADRIEALDRHLADLESAYGNDALDALRSARDGATVARTVLLALRNATMKPDVLPGTGGEPWKSMWDAAGAFAAIAYEGEAFPRTKQGSRCVFCQQSISEDAAARLEHFAEYVASTAQADVTVAEKKLTNARLAIVTPAVRREDITFTIQELGVENSELADAVSRFIDAAQRIQDEVKGAASAAAIPAIGVDVAPRERLLAIAATLRERAKELRMPTPGMKAEVEKELRELEARAKLGEHLALILGEIERKKRLAAYSQCIDDASTNAITKKSTELTKRLVTDTLRETFAAELHGIEFTHLDVEIQPVGGSKGALFHRLVFTYAPSVTVTDVLSEGEARALSLAAFLTELSTAATKSTIVFDDPVSSLDHIWRERIARRLVKEATDRQVIVFTHDLLFLHFLIAEAERQNVALGHQYIRRHGQAGIVLPDLPWVAMLIKDRIGVLKQRLQAADKTFRTEPGRYEAEAREIYGLLREAWEQAVGEILLNNVVERYRPSIETNRAKKLYDIAKEECETMEHEMTECSRWIRGHDAPPADGTPIPEPAKIQERVTALEAWVGTIRKRRN